MIKDLSTHSALPWLVGGDLNEIFYNYEKKGGLAKSQILLDAFCATFEECGLYDLGYSDYPFTWDNRRAGLTVVEERLDRFCGSLEWSLLFPEAEVIHLDEHFSDHLPILLKTQKNASARRRAARSFKFENMWVQDTSCKDIVKTAWEGVTECNTWANLEAKLWACSQALIRDMER